MPTFSSLKVFSEANIGGLNAFVFAPVNDILDIPVDVDYNITGMISFKPGKDWQVIQFTEGTCSFNEDEQISEMGSYYKQAISLSVPKDTASKTKLFDLLRAEKFIVLYQDNNGLRKLVGSLEFPLRFRSSFTTGERASSKNGFNISLVGTSPNKAYTYTEGFDFNNDFNNDYLTE